jgi:hypothetical protein
MESELHQKTIDRIDSMGFQYMSFTIGRVSGKYMYTFKCEHGCSDIMFENNILQYKIICDTTHIIHFLMIDESSDYFCKN